MARSNLLPRAFEWKKLKNCIFCYYYALENAFQFNPLNIFRGHGRLVTWAKGHISLLPTFSNDFSSETTGPCSFEFHLQPLSIGGKKFIYLV